MTPRSRTPLVLGVVLAVVAVVAIAAVVLSRGGDDEGSASTVPPASAGGSGEPSVDVTGAALTPLPEDGPDPAIGAAAPGLSGVDYAGNAVDIVPGSGGPMVVVFLAHWCPHCNDEIPVLQEWQATGGMPEDLQVVGVSTAVTEERPNYPPGEWLAENDWDWPVLADDASSTAAQAYGLTFFPFMTFIDADGAVTARVFGELPVEDLQALATATV